MEKCKMENFNTSKVVFIGNYFGLGPGYDGAVFDMNYLSPALLASNCNGNVPKFLIKEEKGKEK